MKPSTSGRRGKRTQGEHYARFSQALAEAGKALTSSLHLEDVLKTVMDSVARLLGPENWSLLLFDPKTNELYFELVVGEAASTIKGMRLPIGKGIAGWAAEHRRALVVPSVADDPRFYNQIDKAAHFETQSVVCAPLLFADQLLGVIEMVASKGGRVFDADDLAVLAPFADFVAIAIENARAFQRIEELTLIDEWTSLYNARFLRRCIKEEVERAERYRHPVSVLFMDLDHFKEVNDTSGHSRGSSLLKQIADVLWAEVRNTDRPVRYGGDEFVVVMPETNKEGARNLADRIRNSIDNKNFGTAAEPVCVTATLGIATYPDDANTHSELLEAADRAMYLGKAQGRNRVVDARIVPPNGKSEN